LDQAYQAPRGELTPGTLKAFQVALVEPVAYPLGFQLVKLKEEICYDSMDTDRLADAVVGRLGAVGFSALVIARAVEARTGHTATAPNAVGLDAGDRFAARR